MSEWESYLTDHERRVLAGEFGEPRALREWAGIRARAIARMRGDVLARFGEWVRWLTEAEQLDLARLADLEPQERWVEYYAAIALKRSTVFRAGYRALFGGVRGSVSRLASVGGAPRPPVPEIDPMTGRPYGEILWEPVRPVLPPGAIWVPPRPEPWKEPDRGPGYPVGQPSFPLVPVEPPGTELVGEVVLKSRGTISR